MPYDELLASRVRRLLANESGITERKMFGGLAFLVDGNMAVGARGSGGLMVRVDRESAENLVGRDGAEPLEMRGRPMAGWLSVASEALTSDGSLRAWVERGLAYARSLPAKGG